MTSQEQVYKKFLCQKVVLDLLRVYIDINDETLQLLLRHGLVTDDELQLIEKLGWPSNRNELLHALVKRAWTEEQFQGLLQVLQQTQSEQLAAAIDTRAQQFVEDEKLRTVGGVAGTAGLKRKNKPDAKERAEILQSQGRVDKLLKKQMTVQDQNAVRSLLREKDEELYQLRIESTELRAQLKVKTDENVSLHGRLHVLDKAVTDLLAAIEFEQGGLSVEEAVLDIKTRLDDQSKLITKLHAELDEKYRIESELRNRVTDLNEQTSSLRSICDVKQEETEKLRAKSDAEIAALKQKLATETSNAFSWRKRFLQSQGQHNKATESMQREIISLRAELTELRQKYHVVDKEFGKSKEQLSVVNDRTRKLLATLDLDNQCDDPRVALDFARNVSITRRRGAGVPARSTSLTSRSNGDSATSSTTNTDSAFPDDDDSSPMSMPPPPPTTRTTLRFAIPQPTTSSTGPSMHAADVGSSQSYAATTHALLARRRSSMPAAAAQGGKLRHSTGALTHKRRGALYTEVNSGYAVGSLPPIDGRDSPEFVTASLR